MIQFFLYISTFGFMEISLFASIILFSKDKEVFLALSVSEQQEFIFTVGNKNLSNELLKVSRHPHSLPILSLILFFLVQVNSGY